MSLDEVTLLAYVDGELPAHRRSEVEAAVAANSELAALERAEEERARERREAIDGHPARDGGRPSGQLSADRTSR